MQEEEKGIADLECCRMRNLALIFLYNEVKEAVLCAHEACVCVHQCLHVHKRGGERRDRNGRPQTYEEHGFHQVFRMMWTHGLTLS